MRELAISEGDAFIVHRLAPLSLRRDIALLGMLHKRVLGICHPCFADLFPFAPVPTDGDVHYGHDKQLDNFSDDSINRGTLWKRSIFALIHVYNRVPQHIIDLMNVSKFQAALTKIVRTRYENGHADWKHTFDPNRSIARRFHH